MHYSKVAEGQEAKRLSKVIEIVIIALGIILIALSFLFQSLRSKSFENCVEITATITRIDVLWRNKESSHDVYVEYTYDGKDYKNRLNYWDSTMYEGKTIELYVDVNNPQKISSHALWGMFFIIFFVTGMIFFIIGVIILIISRNNKKLEDENNYDNY